MRSSSPSSPLSRYASTCEVRVDVRAVRAPHLHPDAPPSAREEAPEETKAHLVLLLDVVIRFAKVDDAFGRDLVHKRAAPWVTLESER